MLLLEALTLPEDQDVKHFKPFTLCLICGHEFGLTDLPSLSSSKALEPLFESPVVLEAQLELRSVLAPVLGAWLNKWSDQGLTPQQLLSVFELVTGSWSTPEFRHSYQARQLRYLRRFYKPALPKRG
jgi:hypothetical protein